MLLTRSFAKHFSLFLLFGCCERAAKYGSKREERQHIDHCLVLRSTELLRIYLFLVAVLFLFSYSIVEVLGDSVFVRIQSSFCQCFASSRFQEKSFSLLVCVPFTFLLWIICFYTFPHLPLTHFFFYVINILNSDFILVNFIFKSRCCFCLSKGGKELFNIAILSGICPWILMRMKKISNKQIHFFAKEWDS